MRLLVRLPRFSPGLLAGLLLLAGSAVIPPTVSIALGAPLAQQARLWPGAVARVTSITGQPVNLRDAPGLSTNIIVSVPLDTQVVVESGPQSADNDRWWRVSVPGYGSGWMVEDCLAPTGQTQAVAATAATTGGAQTAAFPGVVVTAVPVGVAQPVVATPVASIAGATTTTTTAPAGGGRLARNSYAIVAVGSGDALNIRSSPSTSAALAGTAPNGAVLVVLDGPVSADGYRWWLISYDGVTGYVAENFIVAAG